jgi:hypothetical protein
MPELLRRYNSSLWIRYPLAQRAKCQVLFSSSGIILSWRYSEIGSHQSVLGLGSPVIALISAPGSQSRPSSPAGVPGLASKVGTGPPSPGRVLGAGVGLSSPGGVPDVGVAMSLPGGAPSVGTRQSSSRWMDGLNKSCVNTPRGGGSRLDPSRARASAALLFCWRI